MNPPRLSVSDFIAVTNQTLEYSYPQVEVVGEVASFKVNQGKFVFFDLKDCSGSLGCFITVWQLRTPIEDGMKIIVTATPKLTQWGKFSLTVQAVQLVGEGNLKKSFELLRTKLAGEGLFDQARKRLLPRIPTRIGVITSTQAAGYGDFIKILDERWGGLSVEVAHTQVQGVGAADQMIRALRYFNSIAEPPEVIVMIRGGGSLDDLAVYNDEQLVREIAASRVPTLVGVGHEVDISLADLVADVRASTPSNAAQILVPDKRESIMMVKAQVRQMALKIEQTIEAEQDSLRTALRSVIDQLEDRVAQMVQSNRETLRALAAYNPRNVLARGYSIIRGTIAKGAELEIETVEYVINAEVRSVKVK